MTGLVAITCNPKVTIECLEKLKNISDNDCLSLTTTIKIL
jgi:hypothetical protein